MDLLKDFFVHNFVLICLAIVMIFTALIHFKRNRRVGLCSILISIFCLVLAVSSSLELFSKTNGHYYLALTFAIIGYVIRPVCIYLFILMNKKTSSKLFCTLLAIPLLINLIIFLLAYIPGMKNVVFGFVVNDSGDLGFAGGPLRFASHVISAGYLIYLLYISISALRFKHIAHGITIIACALFVLVAVIIESFFNGNGDVEILNATIMVSTLTNYIFLYHESVMHDELTGLFTREAYRSDSPKMERSLTAIIIFDIDGLKFINDNYGHLEGDKCISSVANAILLSLRGSMYAYRVGGDEFFVLVNNTSEETVIATIADFKKKISETAYHCAVGYAYKNDDVKTSYDLTIEAEQEMYKDKDEFYKTSDIKRRNA